VETESPPTYRILHLLVRHGHTGVLVLSGCVLALGLFAALMTGAWWTVPLTLVGSALLYIVARSYIELVHVIVDMLLPK